MPIGVIINALSVAAGGVIGALFGHKLPAKINSELTKIFGVCSMGMGVSSIGLMKNMPAVIFAVIIGTAFGLAVNLGGMINGGATWRNQWENSSPIRTNPCPEKSICQCL